MNRRDLLAVLGGAAVTWPCFAKAEQKAMPVIGWVSPNSSTGMRPGIAAFRQGLSETGFVEGTNVAVEYRWTEGDYNRLPTFATDLATRKVDVIVASPFSA